MHPVNAYINSPSSVRLRDVPKKIGNWKIDRVYIEITYPDETNFTVETKLIGGVYVGTFNGCEIAGTTAKGFVVKADGTDENGSTVDGYILGVGDIYILDSDGRTLPQNPIKVVNLVNEKSSNPHVGDALWVNSTLQIYDGVAWKNVGSGVVESEENAGYAENADSAEFAVVAQNASYAANADTASFASWAGNVEWDNVKNKPNIPTKTSDLSNDNDFVDRDFVNSSIATNTAHFLGTYGNKDDFPLSATPNDYVFFETADESGNRAFERYKWANVDDDWEWSYEYTLNNSSFTSEQWETINGGPYATVTDIVDLRSEIVAISEELSYKASIEYVDSQIGQVLTERF